MSPLDPTLLACCPHPSLGEADFSYVCPSGERWSLFTCTCRQSWIWSEERDAAAPDVVVAEWYTPIDRLPASSALKLGPGLKLTHTRSSRRSLRVVGGVATWIDAAPRR